MAQEKSPNIIIMYADDLGFGDIGCYGASNIPTPNLDKLATQGMRFHQGYATAATCTPSRYSLLTGAYPWRNPDAAILFSNDPMIISKDQTTLPSMLKDAGYRTGIVGKWHLGLGKGDIDWNAEIDATPNDVGFDDSYIMAATNDRVPCVYIDNRKVENLDPSDPIEVVMGHENAFPGVPTGKSNPELLTMKPSHFHDAAIVNGVSRIGHMRGGKSALWDDETMAETFLGKAQEFVAENKDNPFFLYYALHQPHVPRIPNPRFKGATPHGPRGDVIVEMDWCIGELMKTLEEHGLADNTIVIFSSDNGPVLDDGYQDQAVELAGDHKPAGPLRGGKYSPYDGGTRVPFIIRWPLHVKPGAESDAVVCHMDFLASFAKLVGRGIDEDASPDGIDVLEALLGKSESGREELITEGTQHKQILRIQDWVYIAPKEGTDEKPELYNITGDIGQDLNVVDQHPDRVKHMARRLEELMGSTKTRI